MLYIHLIKQAIYNNLGIWETVDPSEGLHLIDAIGEFFAIYYRHVLGNQLVTVYSFDQSIHIVMKMNMLYDYFKETLSSIDEHKKLVTDIDYLVMALHSFSKGTKSDFVTENIRFFEKDFAKQPNKYLSPFTVLGSFISLSRECIEITLDKIRKEEKVDESILHSLDSVLCDHISGLMQETRLAYKSTEDPDDFKVVCLTFNSAEFNAASNYIEIDTNLIMN